jgi:hypothetical protein
LKGSVWLGCVSRAVVGDVGPDRVGNGVRLCRSDIERTIDAGTLTCDSPGQPGAVR